MSNTAPYFRDLSLAAEQIGLLPAEGMPSPGEGAPASCEGAFSSETNILVAGATGLIGSCLVDMLMRHSQCSVYAMGRNREHAATRFADYLGNPRFHFLEHDVCRPLTCGDTFHYIVHAASNASPNFFAERPVEVMLSNITGLQSLADYGRSHGMRRMVYVSSGEVYGEGSGSAFREDDCGFIDIQSPRSCYPQSKRAAETLCAAYCKEYGLDIVTARPCHTYGPFFTDSDNRVYAQFIRNVLRGEDIVMQSAGLQYRSWLYVVDAAAAILHLINNGARAEAYNVADARSCITIRQLAELTAQIGGRRVIVNASADGNTTPISRAVFDTAKIELSGWHPLFGISEGLRHTVETLLRVRPC